MQVRVAVHVPDGLRIDRGTPALRWGNGPHRQSIHPRYDGNLANAAFISDLTPLLDRVDLWIHGHVHDSFDHSVGRCRVLTPPRGYALNRRQARVPAERQWENSPFDARCVVAV
ncbi:hypothetical protein [Mycetohabitans rhizoxinica]|uniref:hypothetical protein n=1 Tax=Mycetohabitans rhizoxinica TaxID=412963 RepID=UPI0030CAA2AC